MSWIEINKSFSVYSIRDEFVEYIDWILYFVQAFYGYFIFAFSIILIGLILFGLIKRIMNYAKNLERQ